MTDNPIRNELIKYLQDRPGEQYAAHVIAQRTGLALPSTRQTLHDLVDAGAIRRTTNGKRVCFYIPSQEMLANEQVIKQASYKVLQPRKEMAERIAQIRADRLAIPSLY